MRTPTRLLMAGILVLGGTRPGLAQSVDAPEGAPLAVRTAGAYLVDRSPEDAWDQVQRTLDAMGLEIDARDPDNQVLLTAWRALGSSEFLEGSVPLTSANVPFRVRFEVFVSPFAAPARVYVGSLIEAERESGTTVIYNYAPVNEALLAELVDDIGGRAGSIGEDRSVLASWVPDACRSEASAPFLATNPEVVRLSNYQLMRPEAGPGGVDPQPVRLEYTIFDDGSVGNLRSPAAMTGSELVAAAAGALSMRFYRPGRLANGCAVPVSTSLVVEW